MQRFASAPWPTPLKVTSLLGALILIGTGVAVINVIPHATRVPYAEAFGTLIAFFPPVVGLFALLFIVSGYDLERGQLRVRRLLWSTRIPLAGLRQIYAGSDVMNGSLRVFGNGGLFSYTGLYQNRALGRYRAYVTDSRCAVALFLPSRVVVVSPADIDRFVRAIRSQFPAVAVGPPTVLA